MKKAALMACSDPLTLDRKGEVNALKSVLASFGLSVTESEYLYDQRLAGRGPKRGAELTSFFLDPDMAYIFDVSGGDLANTVLPYIDFPAIKDSRAAFFGYSDLTTILNALVKNGNTAVNFQARNLIYDHSREEQYYFNEQVLTGKFAPECLKATFLRGSELRGEVLGGNLRCLLKLAGTEYWPDFSGKILLLESYGGGVYRIATLLEQCRQLGLFDQVSGILLGTFTELEEKGQESTVYDLLKEITPASLPIAWTHYIGHYTDARAIALGQEIVL